MNFKLCLLLLCSVTVCLSLPSAQSITEEDSLSPTAAGRTLKNQIKMPSMDYRIHPQRVRFENNNNNNINNNKRDADKAKSRQADIDDMMEHLLRIRRRSTRA